MDVLIGVLGVLAALLIMGVSATANALYSFSLGHTNTAAYVMGALAVFVDVGKAVTWVMVMGALKKRQFLAAGVGLVLFVCCMAYAITGSLGFVALQRASTAGIGETRGASFMALKDETARKAAQRAGLGAVETVPVAESAIATLQQDVLYRRSVQCSKATAEDSRAFCGRLGEAKERLAKAQAAVALDSELAALRQQLAGLGEVAKNTSGDIQGELIAKVTNWDVWSVQVGIQLLAVAVIELGACFMLYISMNHIQTALSARRPVPAAPRSEPAAVPPVAVAAPAVEEAVVLPPATSNDRALTVAARRDGGRRAALGEQRVRLVTHVPAPVEAEPEPAPDPAPAVEDAAPEIAPGSPVTFLRDRGEFSSGARVPEAVLLEAYQQWCVDQGVRAYGAEQLAGIFAVVAEEVGLQRTDAKGGVEWVGVALRERRQRRRRA